MNIGVAAPMLRNGELVGTIYVEAEYPLMAQVQRYLAILAVCSPGDEVVIPAPFWVSYPEMVKLAGGKPVVVNAEDVTGFKITPAQLTAALTPRTRMVIINCPSNPTGAVYSRAELEALVAICVKANVWIMSDEIYENLVYDGQTTCSPATFSPEAARLTITVSGYAKSYSMTGWRLGTLVASDKALAAAVADLQSQISSNATTFAQFGALAVHQHPDKAKASLAEMGAVFDKRRLNLLAGLNAIPGLTCYRSQGAFYLFPNIKSFGLTSAQFADRLLEEELMAVVPGSAFGSEGYIRLSYATSDKVIAQGLERLARMARTFQFNANRHDTGDKTLLGRAVKGRDGAAGIERRLQRDFEFHADRQHRIQPSHVAQP